MDQCDKLKATPQGKGTKTHPDSYCGAGKTTKSVGSGNLWPGLGFYQRKLWRIVRRQRKRHQPPPSHFAISGNGQTRPPRSQ